MHQVVLAFLLVTLSVTGSQGVKGPPCCSGENVLGRHKCTDGKTVNLNCTSKYLLDPEWDEFEAFEIDEERRLVYTNDGIRVKPQFYCVTKLINRTTETAVICVEAHDDNNSHMYSTRAILELLSVAFIVATIIVYVMVPELRDLQGKCTMHYLVALCLSMLFLGLMQLNFFPHAWCVFLSFTVYLTFMTTFFWLNVIAFHVWKTVVLPKIAGSDKRWYTMYVIYGYLMPLIFLIVVSVAHHVDGDHVKPNFGLSTCWFHEQTATWTYFYGPMSVLLVMNLIWYVWSAVVLWQNGNTTAEVKLKSLKYKLRLYAKLFIVMGLLWCFELISAALADIHVVLDYIWTVTDFINVLQGFYIFLLLVVFRKRALKGLASKGCICVQFPGAWRKFEDEECEDADQDPEIRLSHNDVK